MTLGLTAPAAAGGPTRAGRAALMPSTESAPDSSTDMSDTTDEDDTPAPPPPPIAATPIEHKPDAPRVMPQAGTPAPPATKASPGRGFGPFPPAKK